METAIFTASPVDARLADSSLEGRTSWALVIATYKRDHILSRCLELAAQQTRPPVEIIVVDASPNWEHTHHRIQDSLAPRFPKIHWIYVKAEKASSAAQRNQGAYLATADVLVFIDDDCLMYPDCAEHLLKAYDLDLDNMLAGVSGILVDRPPDEKLAAATQDGLVEKGKIPVKRSWFRKLVRRCLNADDIFVPYDAKYPNRPIPEQIADIPSVRSTAFAGGRASFRRQLFLKEPFESILERYAAGEDSDMSYRISRHGALIIALCAQIHHLGAHGGRLPPMVVTALGAMNPAVLLRIYGTDWPGCGLRYRCLLRRRLVIQFLKDISEHRWSLPNSRGIWIAIRHLPEIFCRSEAALRKWYPELQLMIIDRYTDTER
jgi:GT2 family glycosyltransferase